jgi:hypothetical protein
MALFGQCAVSSLSAKLIHPMVFLPWLGACISVIRLSRREP